MAEEIAKHAFGLAADIRRGMKQETVTSPMFATAGDEEDDSHLGAMSTPAWAGAEEYEDEEVEDAD